MRPAGAGRLRPPSQPPCPGRAAADPLTAGRVPVLAAMTMLLSLLITPLVSLVTPVPVAAVVAKAFGDAPSSSGLAAATAGELPVAHEPAAMVAESES